MRRAVDLSANGYPAPNPHVGCVIVQAGVICGEGVHDHAGGPHAEREALTRAGPGAAGSTVYVTLEPCTHTGRTPPCAQALIAAGVKRVVIACADPNPRAAGGAKRLADAGIAVEVGLLADEAAEANSQFLAAHALGRPRVVIKAASSLDGRIALPSGESKWITGSASRMEGHRLRAECGVVLVGRRTVETDNPSLTARIEGVVNQPLRVVLDPDNRLTGKENVFNGEAETMHITGAIDLHALLADLFTRGQMGVLVEGGGRTIASMLAAGLADRLELFVAPKVLGDGPAWVSGLGLAHLGDAPELRNVESRNVGEDLWIRAEWVNPSANQDRTL